VFSLLVADGIADSSSHFGVNIQDCISELTFRKGSDFRKSSKLIKRELPGSLIVATQSLDAIVAALGSIDRDQHSVDVLREIRDMRLF
jgi:hypothetical protein